MNTYGYIYIPSGQPDDGGQLASLRQYGVSDDNIMTDHSSCTPSKRSAYRRLLQTMQTGDTLVIPNLACLDLSWWGIADQYRTLTKQLGVRVICLDMPRLAEPSAEDLLLHVLESVAKTDRELTRRRQAEGIHSAREKGVQFGRAPLKKPKNFSETLKLWRSGACNSRTAAAKLKVSQNTFLKWTRESEQK